MSNFSVRVCRLEDYPDFLVSCRKILSADVGIPLDSPYNRMNPGDAPTNIVGSYSLFFVMFDGEKPVTMCESFLYKQKYDSYQKCSIQDMLNKHSVPPVDLSTYCKVENMVHLRSIMTIQEYRSQTVVFPGTLYAVMSVLSSLGMSHVTAMSRVSLLDMYCRFGFKAVSKIDVTTAMGITANDASFIIMSIKDWMESRLSRYIEKRMNFRLEIDDSIVQEIVSRKSLL